MQPPSKVAEEDTSSLPLRCTVTHLTAVLQRAQRCTGLNGIRKTFSRIRVAGKDGTPASAEHPAAPSFVLPMGAL
jgi:hypothetical protein